MNLSELELNQDAVIRAVGGRGGLRRHLLDMGLTPGAEVTLRKRAPMGDPIEIEVRGYELTLRLSDARQIEVENAHPNDHTHTSPQRTPDIAHPGRGEMGVEHIRSYASGERKPPIPEGTPLTFALAGNQNCGKTTLFNQLTGNIVDATNIERNLYLTMQLMELEIPMVLALNMMDEVTGNGGTILVNQLERALGIPVVPISAAKNQGIDELIEHALHVARYREAPEPVDFCDAEASPGEAAVHRCLHAVRHLIEDHAHAAGLPVRFAALKLVEGDPPMEKALALDENEQKLMGHAVLEMERDAGLDREAALADTAFRFIQRLCERTVVKPHASREYLRSQAIDRVLTGKYTAIPMFILIMAAVFYLTFGLIGAALSDALELGIGALTDLCDWALTAYGINPVVHSLVIDGVFAGVGSVLSFLPTIVVLFFFLSILEDSGYMARVAFVMDKLLRRIGLSGRSFVPMLIGFGCSVPAIMASRTLSSERDRRMTILLTPFMSCSAKLPIYAVFTMAFFPHHRALVMISLYLLGMLVGVLFALVLKHTGFKGEPVPFVMELPNYRLPSPRSVGQLIWEKAKDFLVRAFTIIFVATIIIWFLQTFDARLNVVSDPENSLLCLLGGLIAPIFAPLGFGDWRLSTALITGFTAKESVVSTLTVLTGGAGVAGLFATPWAAYTFLVFTLLYTPCVAAIAAVRREMGRRWAPVVVVLQCCVAWLCAFLFHALGLALGLV